jgi:uncharacterized protein Yka (UPF0111/DUF47 family)
LRRDTSSRRPTRSARVDDAGDVACAGLGELFREEPAPIELVRWMDLYERMEAILAAARRAAGTLDMIARTRR